MKLELGFVTDCGRIRDINEDCLEVFDPDDPVLRRQKGALCAVADGLGGLDAGEVASVLAVTVVREHYYMPSSGGKIEQSLRNAVQAANLRVFDEGHAAASPRRMQTTLTAVALHHATAYVAHVGDSRLYHLRGETPRQVTTDHSQVAEMTRVGLLTAEEARQHPYRHIINRTLGLHPIVRPDFQRVPMQTGDYFVLCSDGLWSEIDATELADGVRGRAAQDACNHLLDLAMSREAADNISIIVIRVLDIDAVPEPEGRLTALLRRAGLRGPTEVAGS